MERREAIKIIRKHNTLRKKVKRLRDRLWRESVSGVGFKLCQDRLKEAQKEMDENVRSHRQAIRAIL